MDLRLARLSCAHALPSEKMHNSQWFVRREELVQGPSSRRYPKNKNKSAVDIKLSQPEMSTIYFEETTETGVLENLSL